MVVFRSLLCGLATEPHPFGLSGSKPCADRGAYVGKGREPGVARRRVTFFRFAERKSPKKGRPPVCDPFAVRRGKPASGRLRGAPQNSLRACGAPFEQLRRVSSRSMGAATPMPPRNRPAAGAASRGGTAEQPNSQHGPSLRSASRSRRAAPAPFRPSAVMARGVVRLRVPFCACREAQGRGCVRVPQDTRTSCTDSPQLFERSAQRAVSSAAHPLTEHRRLPVAQRRDTHSRVALSLVTFFRRSERKLLARRATPCLRPALKHVARSASKLPPLSTSMLNASKFIATSAF